MKKMKIYILTYKRSKMLNDTLDKLFKSDFARIKNTEVTIINNHTEFYLNPLFRDRVKVLHNSLRPDCSNGNMAENWNQALINGFIDLNNPDCEYLVTLQNDTAVHPNWYTNLMKLHEKFNFVVGRYGDNLVSYTPEAVKKIGMWDENFASTVYKEADYWIRALIFNKEKSFINDTLHGLELNNENYLELDTAEDRNFLFESNNSGDEVLKRKADDSEHQAIWNAGRGGMYKAFAWKYFNEKWSNTWVSQPEKIGWIKHWSREFVKNPPDIKKSNVKIFIKYPYFEKDIEDLHLKNYLVV
jgi:hypothetical protein